MEKFQKAKEAKKNIEKILDESALGWKNEVAIKAIQKQLSIIDSCSIPGVSEKITNFEKWADIIFSERKHSNYSAGVMQVKRFAMEELCNIERLIDRAEKAEEKT